MTALLFCLSLVLTPGHVMRTIDGDTFVLYHVGTPPEERVRVLGIDAWELKEPLGPAGRSYTTEWLSRGPFKMEACKRDNFGRLLGIETRGTDTLAVDLVAAGLAVPYR